MNKVFMMVDGKIREVNLVHPGESGGKVKYLSASGQLRNAELLRVQSDGSFLLKRPNQAQPFERKAVFF